MAVPYVFSLFPGGSSIPLADLDANFAYLTDNPTITGNLTVSGNLSVAQSSTFTGPVTMGGGLSLRGPLTVNGISIPFSGVTGTGLWVFNNGPTLINPILGMPVSGNLQNCSNYPISSITGLGSGILQFLVSPSSATLAGCVPDRSGSGSLVFNTNASLINPNLNVPSSGDLINCQGYLAANLTGIVPVSKGGTGASNATDALNNLLPPQGLSAGKVLATNGTSAYWESNTIGSVTSVDVSGGSTGLTFSGGPITGAGTITMAGTLAITNGGTGMSTLGAGVATGLATPVNTTNGFVTYPNATVPAGAVFFFAMSTAPAGYFVANGAAVSRTTYADLFAAIGTLYGPGDGTTTFNIPNLNGQFVRGWDPSNSVDPGRAFGSNQAQSFSSHTHAATVIDPGHQHNISQGQRGAFGGSNPVPDGFNGATYPSQLTAVAAVTGITVSNAPTGGAETRPVNVALLACIKW